MWSNSSNDPTLHWTTEARYKAMDIITQKSGWVSLLLFTLVFKLDHLHLPPSLQRRAYVLGDRDPREACHLKRPKNNKCSACSRGQVIWLFSLFVPWLWFYYISYLLSSHARLPGAPVTTSFNRTWHNKYPYFSDWGFQSRCSSHYTIGNWWKIPKLKRGMSIDTWVSRNLCFGHDQRPSIHTYFGSLSPRSTNTWRTIPCFLHYVDPLRHRENHVLHTTIARWKGVEDIVLVWQETLSSGYGCMKDMILSVP
jgi:hypothetical protein